MNNKEVSELSLSRKECEKCGAVWINGNHIWGGTGNQGSESDLAGLVCNKLGDHRCINPMKGSDGGQTWEYRAGYIDGKIDERKQMLAELNKLSDE
jgi:hypothetical protein|tara:strand:- start:852 stop:1139 length:288 start_codon:yes stop_codon:yes gene_type:complete